jgi:hypothetical protein
MNFLHNMSAPPRTSITLRGDTVAGQTKIVCFVWALARKVHPTTPTQAEASKRTSKKRNRGVSWNWERDGIPRIGHDVPDSLPKLALRLRDLFENPADFFAQIGQPIAPEWAADFLIGYRVRYEDLNTATPSSQIRLLKPVFCRFLARKKHLPVIMQRSLMKMSSLQLLIPRCTLERLSLAGLMAYV